MRDRRCRWAVVGLMLAFPVLLTAAGPRPATVREAVVPVLATQAILIGGLSAVARERRRLLAARPAATPRPAATAPRRAPTAFRGAPLAR